MYCLWQHDGSQDHSDKPDKPGTPPSSPQKAEALPAQLSLAQADMQEGVQDAQASMRGKQQVQEDSQAKVGESDTSTHTNHAQLHLSAAEKPKDESEQQNLSSATSSIRTSQHQPDSTESAHLHSIDRQSHSSDESLPSALDPQATNDNLQPNSTHLDSFGSLIETRPDSNGNADTHSTPDAPIQEATTSGLAGLALTAAAADDQTDNAHSVSTAAELMAEAQPEQQAEQQLPISSLYMSSQMDQSSRSSLAESVQSVPASQQQPVSLESVFASQPQPESPETVSACQHQSASPSSVDEASELEQAASKQVTSTAHGGEGSAADQEASGSQQSSLDNHDLQAELPGTPASSASVPSCVNRAGSWFQHALWLVGNSCMKQQHKPLAAVHTVCFLLLSKHTKCWLWLLWSTH